MQSFPYYQVLVRGRRSVQIGVYLAVLLWELLIRFSAFSQQMRSDFSHIEIIMDSASFEKLVANDFVRNKLASCSYDTMSASTFVLSYYLAGRDDFIHFNPSRGYFKTQLGTAYLIFQSRRPGQGKLLEKQWREVATDTIIGYEFKGPDFILTEIVYAHHDRLGDKQHNNLIPMLSSYSVDSYRSWGLGDSAEISINQFLASSPDTIPKLYERITSIDIALSTKELRDLIPVMTLVGYRKKRHRFVKDNEPTIAFIVDDTPNRSKVLKLTLRLSKDAGREQYNFGTVQLDIKKRKAVFNF